MTQIPLTVTVDMDINGEIFHRNICKSSRTYRLIVQQSSKFTLFSINSWEMEKPNFRAELKNNVARMDKFGEKQRGS